MITATEQEFIREHAYVPEHLPHYVSAISQTEAFLEGEFVVHVGGSQLVFVGFPLKAAFEEARLLRALEAAQERFRPAAFTLIAPAPLSGLEGCTAEAPDAFYRLELARLHIPKKVRNMLARARREVSVTTGRFGREHRRLVDEFLRARRLDAGTRFLFQRLPEYLQCESAVVFEARTVRGDLVAFDVGEFGAHGYAFYMFNFRSRRHRLPGVSDLLLAHLIERAQGEGKRYLNLGLGIDAGVSFFKRKWGAAPFLECHACAQDRAGRDPAGEALDLFSRL